MGNCTLSQARDFIEPGYGDCSPDKLTKAVNMIRNHMFGWYQELGLFLDAVECFELQRFPDDCLNCSSYYSGITLPRGYAAIEAMWFNEWPVSLQSSWREFQVGLSSECDCRLQKFDLPGTFPTFADIDPAHPAAVKVRAFNDADIGKKITVRGIAATGEPFTEEFTLSTSPKQSAVQFRSIARAGGVIKDRTAGRIVLTDETGRPLGMYEPDETAPSYRRVKVTGLGGCGLLNVRAARSYVELFADTDVVETDNRAAFDAMARFLRIYEKSSKTGDDARAEKDYYATGFKMMMGEKSREIGKATQAAVTIKTPPFGGGRRLLGRGGRAW